MSFRDCAIYVQDYNRWAQEEALKKLFSRSNNKNNNNRDINNGERKEIEGKGQPLFLAFSGD